MKKQFYMLKLIYEFDSKSREALENYVDVNAIISCSFKERIGRAKYIPEDNLSEFDEILKQMNAELKGLAGGEDV